MQQWWGSLKIETRNLILFFVGFQCLNVKPKSGIIECLQSSDCIANALPNDPISFN